MIVKDNCKNKWALKLLFSACFCLQITSLLAQPANSRPIIKYAINNYASIAKAICDTCPLIAGKPLQQFRPIPFPPIAAINAIAGVDINTIPGIAAPNFLGGGSPEIKGLVKKVAGMTDTYAERLRKDDKLYFKTGAHGIAVSNSGTIITSSSTFLPGVNFNNSNNLVHGIFSFKSAPKRLPVFNETSDQEFKQSSKKFILGDGSEVTYNMEIEHFAIDPENENILYASLRNPALPSAKILAKRNPNTGKWQALDWDIPGGLAEGVWGALAVDKHGNLYVADPERHIIVKVTFDNAGKANSWQIIGGKLNTPGFVNDEDGQDARFKKPSGICVDRAGNIYIGDAGNNVIRIIDEDGEVTTYAGDAGGVAGFKDDHSWSDAKFDGPTAVAYNEVTKTLYAVDFNNKTIREINDDREVSTLAGIAGSINPITEPQKFAMSLYYILAQLNMDPDEAKFDNPTGIAIDPSGFGLYVSDGNYIKYVNTSETIFTVTSAIGDPKALVLGLPILPLGIKMNNNNGAFYGVPLLPWEPTTYGISVTNHVGTSLINGFITFEVVACPAVPDTFIDNKIISLSQLPYTWNGKVLNAAGTATVTLKGALGCDSVAKLNLLVKPEFNYNSEPYIFTLGQQIKPFSPTTAGSTIDVFSISPALPTGLTLNTQTGEISGAPLAYATSQLAPAIGPQTPKQYPAPWPLSPIWGADITGVKIVDGNQKAIFENNTAFKSLQGSAGLGTGTPGAYTDFSGLGAIKMSTNSPYAVRLSNALGSQYVYTLNQNFGIYNFKNSYAVYIDYNRDGDFDDAGERVYISAGPQRDAHAEVFNLKIPVTATAGVTKMRIYCVEARTSPALYFFTSPTGQFTTVGRTTSQALSFYPFYNDISSTGQSDFSTFQLNYGEFEDYNIDIQNPLTQAYVITGSNQIGTAQSTIHIAVNNPSTSSSNATICSTELPYNWNGLTFSQAGTQTAHLINMYGADSAATLNFTVKQATSSINTVAYCGNYTYNGVVYSNSGDYTVHLTNAAGCDSSVILRFRQKATASITNVDIIPGQLPYSWNGVTLTGTGSRTVKLVNAEGCDSNATINLRVLYHIYYSTNNKLEINKTITPLMPQIEGNYPLGVWYNAYYGYNISPALPNGLVLDPITGVISGKPTQLSPLKTYTITLNQDGAIPASFTLSVGVPTASTTTINNCGPYTWNGVVYSNPTTVTVTLLNQYGFDSSATLMLAIRNPSVSFTNLFVNQTDLPVTWNGITITKESSKTIYLVNAVGCDSAATVNVVVGPKISYTTPQILRQNQPIVPISPQNLGGNIASSIGNVSTLIKNNNLTPLSIAIDRQDNTYVSDSLDGNIYKITCSGVLSTVAGFGAVQAFLAIDAAGNMYVADRLSNRILKKDISGTISILANASSPNGIAVDAAGNVYFSEGQYHRIRKISTAGVVSTLAGGTTAGFADGNGAAAKFNIPSGLSVDLIGNVYVADYLNNRIRKVTPAGDVTTVAGTGTPSSIDGPSNTARFNAPIAVVHDAWGNRYVADKGSSKIRKIHAQGMVSTLAGTTIGYQDGAATQAKFNVPMALVADQHGNIYVADKANAAIRQINSINYAISPSLITGLQFDEITGIISGTPTDTLVRPVTHKVYAFNKAGADSSTIVIAVCNPAATTFAKDTCNEYRWNDSTYTSTTTHTRYFKNQGGCDSVVTMHLTIRKSTTGLTTTATACGKYVWKGVTYDKTGVYSKVYPNADGCDSTIYLNLTIKLLSTNNLFVDISPSQLPYSWRGKIFTVPGKDSIVLANSNSVGCDSIITMTVRISPLLPNISYATKDTVLYWDKKIDIPIVMTNTGAAIPQRKLAERDTLINFSNNGPGDFIRNTVKGLDGNYYATQFNSNQIFKLSSSGVWSVFATPSSSAVKAMAVDKLGNMYVGLNSLPSQVMKITPNGVVNTLNGSPIFYGIDAMAVDVDNNLILAAQKIDNQLQITKFNLTTSQYVQTQMDYSPYIEIAGDVAMNTDSKGNIYVCANLRTSVMKIKPNGQVSGIGQKGTSYSQFTPGNGTDAMIPGISSMTIDTTNDNVYLMAYGRIIRVDTSANVSAVTSSWFEQWKDQIFRVDAGKIAIINNTNRILFTANVHGIGSIPFMDNWGANGTLYGYGIPNFKDFDKRIRLDSSGAIVGTPRGTYNTQTGTVYAANTATVYSIVTANQYGITNFPMVITTKTITYINETFVTTSFPFIWRGRTFNAATDTATYFAKNKTLANDTLYTLYLLYEVPAPAITATGNCAASNITLTANNAAKNAIGFDGNNVATIKYSKVGSTIPYVNFNYYPKPNNVSGFNPSSAYEFWIKPTVVTGTQYLFTKDTVQSHGGFIGVSIQNEKLVYEFTKGNAALVAYKLTSTNKLLPNVWTHVAATYYDSALHVFINGQLEGVLQTPNFDFTNTYYDPITSTTYYPDFFVGGLGRQNRFKGEMDELRVWSTARNAATIQATRNTLVAPSSTGLAMYYRFDGDVSDVITDISTLHRGAKLIKPTTSISPSKAPINFASYLWTPGLATTSAIVVNPASNITYTLKVEDYKGTTASTSLLVATRVSNTTETIRACGSSYVWHGNTYNASTNTATWKGVNQYGCDSNVTLNLTLLPLPTPVISGAATICIGNTATLSATGYSSYAWLPGGQTTPSITVQPNATTTYMLQVTDANGCSATVTKTIVVGGPSSFTEKISACTSYIWHGNTYTSSNNTATWMGVNAAGCDSLVTLNLTINPLPVPVIVAANGASICMGSPLQITARASGRQLLLDGKSRVVEDAMGVNPYTGFTLEGWVNLSNIGSIQSMISQTLSSTPLPFDAYVNANGTVSFAVGNGSNTSSITTATALTAASWHHLAFVYSNQTIAIYMDGVSSATGAAVIPVAGKLNNFMIGNNESLSRPMVGAVDEIRVWNMALSQSQIAGNRYASVLANSNGLVAYYKFDEADNELPVNAVNGATTATIIGNAQRTTSTAPINYLSYNWTGNLTTSVITAVNTSTLYTLTVTDVNGCSATTTGKAAVVAPSTFTEVVKACGPYNWHGVTYPTSNNTAQWTTKNAAGCDSVVTLNLNIGQPSASIETAVACNYFIWHGKTYTNATTTATWLGVNASGCDSVVTLHLTIMNAAERTDTVTSCGAYTWHDSTYTASTNAPVWYGIRENGCDSIVHLNLTIADFPVAHITAMIKMTDVCQGEGIQLHNANGAFIKYATGVTAFSSEISQHVIQQIVGKPDTYPNYGDYGTAWSTKDDLPRREFVELTYDNAEPINFIDIYETFNSGTIDTVYVKNPETGLFEVVYSGTAELYNQPLQNRISFPLTPYAVSTIRLAINSVDLPAQKSIDAVGIGIANSYAYRWTDGSTADTLSVNNPGDYVLTTTNPFGCSVSDTIHLSASELQQGAGNMLIASANATVSKNVVAGTTTTFEKDCALIASVQSTGGASAVNGPVTGKIWIEPTTQSLNGRPYLRRHFEITPNNNAANATGIITLYFTQADFNDFNTFPYNGPDLPTGPDDDAGISNFAIYKYSGISSNGTGLPNTYPQPGVLIKAPAINLVWDAVNNYWKASFATTGFSGFFAGNIGNIILPINDLLRFEVVKSGTNGIINWQVAAGHNINNFVVEKSMNGMVFTPLQTVVGSANTTSYQAVDASLTAGLQYYRLKLLEKDGSYAYSAVKTLLVNRNQVLIVSPNPTNGRFTIDLQVQGQPNAMAQIQLQDITGKIIYTQQASINNGALFQAIDMPSSAANGMYIIKIIIDGKTYHSKLMFEK